MMEPDNRVSANRVTKPPRRIACVRCRTRKKRCDHAIPVCGECKKSGSECIQAGIRRSGSVTTVPTAYLQQLETQLSELQDPSSPRQGLITAVDEEAAGHGDDQESGYPSPMDNDSQFQPWAPDLTIEVAADDPSPMASTRNAAPSTCSRDTSLSQRRPASRTSNITHDTQLTKQRERALIGKDWLDHYAHVYFCHIQPQWSFLDEEAWNRHFNAWNTAASKLEGAQLFILHLVLAIGALLSSSYRHDCPHLTHAQKLQKSAVRHHLLAVNQHPDPLIRTQAFLLILIHAFHDSSHDAVQSSIMVALMNCGNLIFTNVSKMEIDPGQAGFYEHLFQLRRIQSKIRHSNKKLQRLDPSDPFRERCRMRLKQELQDWKESVQSFVSASPPDNVVYHEPGSLFKLYDYGISILMQERPSMMGVEDIGQLVECCSEACRTFRSSQQANSVIYWTWTALMYQFRIGVMLLYCFYMTPPMLRTPVFSLDTTLSGIENCRQTLEGFASRWPTALVFLQTYQLLAQATFDGFSLGAGSNTGTLESPTTPALCATQQSSSEWKSQMVALITELKLQHVHQAVVTLVQEMVHNPRALDPELGDMEFAPTLTLGELDLFNF
ncbi:hypothetical protein FALBO_9910 [Fusarium albosuccineum]|uniref:Zn(2)-C6 fungal-type domain-containing protein n=1 Tax=Fusarium albosuccineum TaxID=1237068 RepID=A0A8H4L554_9HYPO|nr:hypothetical protein FALBO_9910 [Fusarium albosuccineum]